MAPIMLVTPLMATEDPKRSDTLASPAVSSLPSAGAEIDTVGGRATHVTIEVSVSEPTDAATSQYEFLPSAASILEEIVPASFKVKLFKCFLDAAVSEQIARMVAMKSATENADDLIRHLSMQYNRARQSRITSELMDVIGGVEAIA